MKHLLAVDWGTSSLRGALLDRHGKVLQERTFARGILTVPPGEFATVFEACFEPWTRAAGTFCLISGMAGSRQGWVEAPYCACPAGLDDIARQLVWVTPGCIAIVPGLRCEQDSIPDVMRGEETQVFGALQLLDLRDAVLVLPGTHSKWVRVASNRMEHFTTFMTGEFYALLRQHSILARTLPGDDGDLDVDAFNQGVALALHSASLLQTAFSARTLSLFERLPAAALPSYLSGLVIGEELRTQPLEAGAQVVLVGADTLTQRYELALAQRRVPVRRVGQDAAWRGLWAIASALSSSPTGIP
ncbi:2-dehydro-3-deoxygalactonokinase [Rhodoferax sediminis]|uniref:2-dehydro-3-deoxygalactonokinase n=1 Tax=Rhodoferax sediminis TaxID=2509614 RepID=A0A515DDE0_9BURK|nr:2-dehydro-3-deoxygalactonokinase [Rhodoferax sediminis]QDL38405.1 2-dehydro-3-deoxygalactonokinase [Rhodoferax sediminis]